MRKMRNVQPNHLTLRLLAILMLGTTLLATENLENRPDRVKWLGDLGFGLFIHWSMDVQLGPVISHSLVGASKNFTEKYFKELPKTFNPKKFDAGRLGGAGKVSWL